MDWYQVLSTGFYSYSFPVRCIFVGLVGAFVANLSFGVIMALSIGRRQRDSDWPQERTDGGEAKD